MQRKCSQSGHELALQTLNFCRIRYRGHWYLLLFHPLSISVPVPVLVPVSVSCLGSFLLSVSVLLSASTWVLMLLCFTREPTSSRHILSWMIFGFIHSTLELVLASIHDMLLLKNSAFFSLVGMFVRETCPVSVDPVGPQDNTQVLVL